MYQQHNLYKNGTKLMCVFWPSKQWVQVFVEEEGETFIDDVAALTSGWRDLGWTIELEQKTKEEESGR